MSDVATSSYPDRAPSTHFLNPIYRERLPAANRGTLFLLLNEIVAASWGEPDCAVSQAKLAERTGRCVRTVRRLVRQLEDLGIVKVLRTVGRVCILAVQKLARRHPGHGRPGTPDMGVRPSLWRINGARASDQRREVSKRGAASKAGPDAGSHEPKPPQPWESEVTALRAKNLPFGEYLRERAAIIARYKALQ